MKNMTVNQKKLIYIALAIFILIFVILNRGRINHNREIIKEGVLNETDNAADFHISSQSIMVWDNKTLYFYRKDGELFKKVTKKEDDMSVFFANNYAFIYDKDLKKLYEYSELGEHLNTIKFPVDVFNIKYQNKNIIIHGKTNDGEILYKLKTDGSFEEIYKTSNFILAYDIEDTSKDYIVTEITTSANGYKNTIVGLLNGEKIYKDFQSEVGLSVNISKGAIILVTDKNLYRINNEESIHKDIPNISDVLVEGNKTILLHSGIISVFNKKLEEKHKYIIAANVDKLAKVSSSIYVYGKNDIGGEIGTKNEFYTRLGTSVDKIEINGLTIGALKDNKVTIYKIVNTRNLNKNTVKDLSKE